MSASGSSRSGGPASRRSFTAAQKIAHLVAYDAATERNAGSAYLREHGLYSSHLTEWRRLRGAGLLAGKQPGERIGRPTAEQVEIARLRRELEKTERRLRTSEVALGIMGKTHELLAELSKSSRDEPERTKP